MNGVATGTARRPGWAGRRAAVSGCWGNLCAHLPSQALTLSGLASTHFLAASSGFMLSAVMYFATRFWSSLVQLKFLISAAPDEPDSANLVLSTLFSLYSG